MPSLSDIARDANIPRRTVQYWYDNEVIDENDLELVRMLRPFTFMALPIGQIKKLGRVLRQTVLEHKHQTKDEADHFAPYVKAARQGKPATLAVQFIPTPGNVEEPFTFGLRAGRSLKALASWLDATMEAHGGLPIVCINLREALRHREESNQ